jgi:glycosyltransferase involved in cell wall biosynthesis
MPAPSTVVAAQQIGRGRLDDHYNIGFWPWELPEMPAFWLHAYHFVDEIWASTNFTHAAFSRSSPALVLRMPFAVQTDESDKLPRQYFGLADDKFLFGCAVDGLSGFARKGPLAAVHAFKQAFTNEDQSVGLVIKGIRAKGDPAWVELLDAVGNDERVHFVTQSLPRGSMFDLWRALDCFVSLHRSEGFGRNIAETMLLGKPVIVTAHSGNMDFTDAESAALVTCSLRPVAQGEYPFGKGQLWAEPNVAVAARQMRRIATDAPWRDRLARAGQARIATMYNPERVGEKWCARLNAIYSA